MEILEGTWEEIRAHDSELAGRRVRLILVDEAPNSLAETDPRWERFIGAVEAPEPTSASQIERDFGRILEEKHAKGNL